MNYLEGNFFLDLISILPVSYFVKDTPYSKVFKLFRLPRLLRILDSSTIVEILDSLQDDKETDTEVISRNMTII